jgi:hypothetical protein
MAKTRPEPDAPGGPAYCTGALGAIAQMLLYSIHNAVLGIPKAEGFDFLIRWMLILSLANRCCPHGK